jgi:hypothetical protein
MQMSKFTFNTFVAGLQVQAQNPVPIDACNWSTIGQLSVNQLTVVNWSRRVLGLSDGTMHSIRRLFAQISYVLA